MASEKKTNKQIEERYITEDRKVTQERNDFLLPQILDFVRGRKWMNLHPEYQRRQVWDRKKKSLFIESMLMNLPVPPVFLFEPELSRYEVMDGQQRLSTIVDFYANRIKLTGLEYWKELNGKTYDDMPPVLQRGLDRRRISAVVLQSTHLSSSDESLKRIVFERLNTGGQKLNAQELRNCVYASGFSALLERLAGQPQFSDMWGIPRYDDNIRDGHISATLAENALFKRMIDCELVLRFFAFRKRANIKGSVKSILDNCMSHYKAATPERLDQLEQKFVRAVELAHELFGDEAFKIKQRDEDGELKHSQPFYDAVIVACDHLCPRRDELVRKRKAIRRALVSTFDDPGRYELLVGRANTAASIKERLDLVDNKFVECL